MGIGYETVLALYKAGAKVMLTCRDPKRAKEALIELQNTNGKGQLESALLDLSDLDSVKFFSNNFIQNHDQLDILINNAGISMPPASKTKEGYELQFGVNFIGHFAHTGHLYPLLKSTPNSRIVTVSSNGYQITTIDFDNLKSVIDYVPLREYRQSKLADLIFSIELQRRITAKGDKVLSIAVQPGANKIKLTRYLNKEAIQEGIERLGEVTDPVTLNS